MLAFIKFDNVSCCKCLLMVHYVSSSKASTTDASKHRFIVISRETILKWMKYDKPEIAS